MSRSAVHGSEYSPLDVALAVVTAAAVMGGSAFVLHAAASKELAAAPEIDIGVAAPVRVVPVLDLDAPQLKLGGRRAAPKLPSRWVRKPKPKTETEAKTEPDRKARPSPHASASEKDMPPPDVEVGDAGAPADASAEPDTAPADAGTDAAEAAASAEAAADGVPGEGTGGTGPVSSVAGPGHPDGIPGGTETDPLKARAADIYRARLAAWFSSRFRVSGSGLPQSTLTKLRAGATVQIAGGRTVGGYTLSSSGNAVFDAAARAALESTKGQTLPPPPENYPDILPSQITATLVCKEGQCD